MPSLLTPRSRSPNSNVNTDRSNSPNYFGLVVDSQSTTVGSSGSAQVRRERWSPPSSSVRSAAASSPQTVPINQSKDYEVFKRQAERRSFTLASSSGHNVSPGGIQRSSLEGHMSSSGQKSTTSRKPSLPGPNILKAANIDGGGNQTYKTGSPKRLLSSTDTSAPEEKSRRGSPPWRQRPLSRETSSDGLLFQDPSVSDLSTNTVDYAKIPNSLHTRAETLPSNLELEGFKMASPQHVVNILDSQEEESLVLDLRVSTHYVRSHIRGALNLCIPTTLLKRPSYNVHRLADTFKDEGQKFKFENWRSCARIIVYDHTSSQIQEAQGCVNILRKFESEGWMGNSCIIRGGFVEFASRFPTFVESGPDSQPPDPDTSFTTPKGTLQQPATPSVAPVIGGCPMPTTTSPANPFFGNIRQNMDLIGGVGQMAINLPKSATSDFREQLPPWLQAVTREEDCGQRVSDKFLQIEKREQRRMQEALSGDVVYGSPAIGHEKRMQIAGLEKGAKNRYNNIWPFEHSRMKLKGVAKGGCDYINANLVQTSISTKRYIATQAPIPATFSDFWSMIWQNDVRVIVMLTAEKEGSQVKAHNYWESKHFGQLRLSPLTERRATLEPTRIHRRREFQVAESRQSSLISDEGHTQSGEKSSIISEQPYVIVRKFTLVHESEPFARVREITQLQYSHWPDFGAPANPSHLLGLIEQCNTVVRSVPRSNNTSNDNSAERPVLVHCSAGCGRTGTFCTVDSVIDAMSQQKQQQAPLGVVPDSSSTVMDSMQLGLGSESERKQAEDNHEGGSLLSPSRASHWLARNDIDLVEKAVEELRLQRLSMVQSLRQFVLAYETVLEWLVEQSKR